MATAGLSVHNRAHPGTPEHPLFPQPRAAWSGKSGGDLRKWHEVHTLLTQEAAAWSRGPIFIGDSITERMTRRRATEIAAAEKKLGWPGPGGVDELVEVVQNGSLATRWGGPPLLLGIGGDETQHLLWRMLNGELPTSLTKNERALFLLHIGTNNLGWGLTPTETADGVLGVVDHLLERVAGRLLITELLPRVQLKPWGRSFDGATVCPGIKFCAGNASVAIEQANALIRQGLAAERFARHRRRRRFHLTDCGEPFRRAMAASWRGEPAELDALMPDGLHPSTAGYRRMFRCWERQLETFAV